MMRFVQITLITLTLAGLASSSLAQDSVGSPSDPSFFNSLWEQETLTNNWFGAGDVMEEHGVTLSLGFTQVYQQNLRGGTSTHRHAGRYSGRYDLELEVDLETLVGWSGGTVYAQARGGWSDGLDDSSIVSIAGVNALVVGDRAMDLWQLYLEQSLLDDRFFFRVGKIDLTGGFECADWPGSFDGNAFANDESSQFLNGALVNNPTIPFPDPGLSIMVHAEPIERVYFSAAVADANADVRETGFSTTFGGSADFFSIFELGFMPEIPSKRGGLQGGYRIGFWYDPQSKDQLNGRGSKTDDMGFYLSLDQMVYRENDLEDDSQGLGLFARYGWADDAVSEIENFWSVGAQYQGLIPNRDDDVLAFGVGQGLLSSDGDFSHSHETSMELYYNMQITPWMSLSPSAQYIFNPGGEEEDAVVVGARLHITF